MLKLGIIGNFAAAHRLKEHKGLCVNVHGHTYKVEVEIGGNPDPFTGMLMDFTDLKALVARVINSEFDHSIILNAKDDELIKFFGKASSDFRVHIMADEPTVENISKRILFNIKSQLQNQSKGHILTLKVKIWESEFTYAEREEEL
jgi:6-pyruvoyltetrahydropterin/6-carboxytetrahydropterin synthase